MVHVHERASTAGGGIRLRALHLRIYQPGDVSPQSDYVRTIDHGIQHLALPLL